ncbi:MAG TPA: hypothetical protein VEI97_11070 [bacterium]|nr:hypothetical protein [bacterium]
MRTVAIMVALVLVAGCGGQGATPKAAPAGKSGIPPADAPLDPGAVAGQAEQVPPFFDPNTSDGQPVSTADGQTAPETGGSLGTAGSTAQVPGPLAGSTIEADGLARFDLADAAGSPTTMAQDIPVHLTVSSQASDRGYEILATIRTPKPKAEGGFLYLTTSTGGGPGAGPVDRSAITAGRGADGHWHYGAATGEGALGLLNLRDLAAHAAAPPAGLADQIVVDQFEARLSDQGELIITGAGSLADGRRAVLMAHAASSTVTPAADPGSAVQPGTDPQPPPPQEPGQVD